MAKKISSGFLAANIRFLRLNADMSQVIFAARFGCTRNNVDSYESGTVPKLSLLLEIANYFGTTIEAMYYVDLSKAEDGYHKASVFHPAFPIDYAELREGINTTETEGHNNINIPRDPEEDVPLNNPPNSPPTSKNKRKGGHHEDDFVQKEKGAEHAEIRAEREEDYYRRNDHLINVPILDISAEVNSYSGFLAQDSPEVVRHILLPDSMLKSGKRHLGITVINDSMYPTLQINDTLIVCESDVKSIKDGYIYVIVSRDRGMLVKRLKNRIREHGFICCRSDNRYYKSFNINEDEIVSLFEVVFKISYNLSNENDTTMEMIARLETRIDELDVRVKSIKKSD